MEHFPQAYSEPQMLLVEDPPGRDQTPQQPKVVEKKRGDFRDDLGGFWGGLGIRHPTHPYLEKFSQKKTFS